MVLQNSGRYRAEKRSDGQSSGQREDSSEFRVRQAIENNEVDEKYGFIKLKNYEERTGFLINMHTTEVLNDDKRLVSAVDYYFIEEYGRRFKVSLIYSPYFYVLTKKECIKEVSVFLTKKYAGAIVSIEQIAKEDLDLPNHLIGLKNNFLKLSFATVSDLVKVRQAIASSIRKHKHQDHSNNIHYTEMLKTAKSGCHNRESTKKQTDQMENIIEIREYDVPYHVRVSIDLKIFVGAWYDVKDLGPTKEVQILKRTDLIDWPDMIVLAFDIETTKLPLKFPDSATDQVMMISYMIDTKGFLITNREIISSDVEDFEYNPKPEFPGSFVIYNEPNEEALLRKFFNHILDVKPHIFVTYNGDFFDWSFVEARASVYEMEMKKIIGFSKNREGVYFCRPSIHMDCLCWVKRDSYLPVGSQNLKAVAKAKLRYDPVELDPEDMCRLAAEQPQQLSNYSVSDAVATYYLYMKYVHPFIFALCTIIPMEPDEVLRKGSGTLCEALLMVEAFHANIIFPNKQESILNKMTSNGHILDQETYVGGHVEALESGVFRADIPCRFRMVPEAFNMLIDTTDRTLKHAIEEEEKIPIESVTNFDEISNEVKTKLAELRDTPLRIENPVIYHLDVGAMYPNIILTNRLQPSAMVDEAMCAACDFNKPGAKCQRTMAWMWRGEVMPATRSEFQRVQQQLETEKFPPLIPGGPHRAFHEMSKEEKAAIEKKRLQDYCRKVYKKTHVTQTEERCTTICQKENSFYVDTVRAFRDRRYEYKGLSKGAKKQVVEALKKGDPSEIKSAKSREVLYDSLQLAHKCILNSFYGYVMRKGARWHSMEMAGIVCYTGAAIITKAREIIEQVGRPLELDTDGIWCVLPASFPENYVIHSTHPGKAKVTISYPNAVLNSMVKEHFTNHVYHDLTDPKALKYEIRNENSIFFEVDGPYLAMVLPASKEEGKRLKKRYAVFNFDGSLAELKGFEVKRRGELQLIKIFQSSVFESFLKGDSLEKCYAAVAKVADYWLDVLYSKAVDMPDSELFELISENRSMSRKLEDYGTQKSTSISTAKRLAEFLGDQMVKDAGLSCKFIISRKPEGSPVTERAVPLAIFQAERSVKRFFLRKWLKDTSLDNVDIREVLDWDYYIERLGGAIQKIITIPAAMQGLCNPVPRIRHPDWLHKKMLEKTDTLKQRRINEMFITRKPKEIASQENRSNNDHDGDNGGDAVEDMEDIQLGKTVTAPGTSRVEKRPTVHSVKRRREISPPSFTSSQMDAAPLTWHEALGSPPPFGETRAERKAWLAFQKKKWAWQATMRAQSSRLGNRTDAVMRYDVDNNQPQSKIARRGPAKSIGNGSIGSFLRKAQQTLLTQKWEIIQMVEESAGVMRLWVMAAGELHKIRLILPRIFYVNQLKPREEKSGALWHKCNRILPRAHRAHHLYQFVVPELLYREHSMDLELDLSGPDIDGIYETQVPPEFRALLSLGCLCRVERSEARRIAAAGIRENNTFNVTQLLCCTADEDNYLNEEDTAIRRIYLSYHRVELGPRAFIALFMPASGKALIIGLDTVRTDRMPPLNSVYSSEKNNRQNDEAFINSGLEINDLYPNEFKFETKMETTDQNGWKWVQRALQACKDEKRGPTVVLIQSLKEVDDIYQSVPILNEFPVVKLNAQAMMAERIQDGLDWQRSGSKVIMHYYFDSEVNYRSLIEQARYFQIPVGNLKDDQALHATDLCYARNLVKNNFITWCSPSKKPDLGGRETDDHRLLTEVQEMMGLENNKSACYTSVCIQLGIDSLAINALLQAHQITELEGTSSTTSFDCMPQLSIEEMVSGHAPIVSLHDETALASSAFRILRSMVNCWVRDVSLNRNVFADYLLMNFYRWIRTPQAYLYDPALHRTLHNLMEKLFMQLVAEFKRLGSTVVYANFNKIILCTKKQTVEDAVGYMEYVVTSIRNKELFHGIQMTYRYCWKHLMWLDTMNNGGIKGELPENLTRAGEGFQQETQGQDNNLVENDNSKTQENKEDDDSLDKSDNDNGKEMEVEKDDDDEDSQPEIVMMWNLMDHLPSSMETVKSDFATVVVSYICAIYKFLQDNVNDIIGTPRMRLSGITRSDNDNGGSDVIGYRSQTRGLGIGAHDSAPEFTRNLITEQLAPKLFKITQTLNNKYPSVEINDGVEKKTVRPALEFAKAVCKVLYLDPSIHEEVEKLQANLFWLLNVGEFSEEGQWREMFPICILPEVICHTCNDCRDIDLNRDPYKGTTDDDVCVWQCPSCETPYDNSEIEALLLDIVQRKLMGYVMQDFQCKKCLEVKDNYMRDLCSCAGRYETTVSKDSIIKNLKTYRSIANQSKMDILHETIDWILDMQKCNTV